MATILLVEDNEMSIDMLSRRLRRKGFTVIGAADGITGVQQAQAAPPDLILMDLQLPFMDGWQALTLLRSSETTRRIPIVALTAHAMATDRQKALNSGFDGFAAKPVDFEKLVDLVNRLLGCVPAVAAERSS